MSFEETALKVVITEAAKRIWSAVPKGIDNWRFRRFFGVAAYEGDNIFGVVDPFSHPDPPHAKRYIKKFLGRIPDKFIIGVNDVLSTCIIRIVSYCASTFTEHRKNGRSIPIVTDEQALNRWNGTFLTFGSSDSNIKTYDIETLTEQDYYQFTFGPQGYRRITANGRDFDPSPDKDYGIILKLKNPHSSGHLLFVCAGFGEWGTSGAAYYLLRRWKELYKKFGTKEFFGLIEVSPGSDESARIIYYFEK